MMGLLVVVSVQPRRFFIGIGVWGLAGVALASAAIAAAASGPVAAPAATTVCQTIDQGAATYSLPVDFFTRLIWRESRLQPDAVSPAGAEGIAQFMPGTAALRGLADPFDTATAIDASAHYLADLTAEFGNLGLAAAAYNAGRTASPRGSPVLAACRLKRRTTSCS